MGGRREIESASYPVNSQQTDNNRTSHTVETASSPVNSQQTVSDDDEIDYSIKPEFYDSELDDKDETWVDNKRKGQYSDAVLSCPACFTTLCFESQRHETYVTQYRAMFVVNCKIKGSYFPVQENHKRKRQAKGGQPPRVEESSASTEAVKKVCCDVCSTEVGVLDEDEVYHFFYAIPSES